MDIFRGFKWTKGEVLPSGDQYIVNINLPNGVCWYELSESIDANKPFKWALGIHEEEGWISWVTQGPLYGSYAPNEGIAVVLCDEVPEGLPKEPRGFTFDFNTKQFVKNQPKAPVVRSKAEIQKDLERLLGELNANH